MTARQLAAAVLATAAAAALSACGTSHASTSGSASTAGATRWRSAVTTMAKLQNYRFAGDVVTGGQTSHLAGEFQAPDRIHETVTLPNGAIELVMIGDRAYRRTAPDGAWQQVAGATTGDPRTAFKTLTSAATVVASGTDGYIFTLSGEAARSLAGTTDRLEGTAGLSGRYITDLHYKTSAGSPVDVHLTYQDFDRAPPVTAPA